MRNTLNVHNVHPEHQTKSQGIGKQEVEISSLIGLLLWLEYPKCYRVNKVLPKPPNLSREEVDLARSLPRSPTIHLQKCALSFWSKKLPHYSSFTYLKNSVFSSSDFSVKVFRKFTTSRKSFLSTKPKAVKCNPYWCLNHPLWRETPTTPLAERRDRGTQVKCWGTKSASKEVTAEGFCSAPLWEGGNTFLI